MRLDNTQKKALDHALMGVEGEVYLFGSRIDENKKGGDVDILVFSQNDPYNLSKIIKQKYFTLCEEKLDVVIMDPDNLNKEQQAFLKVIDKERYK